MEFAQTRSFTISKDMLDKPWVISQESVEVCRFSIVLSFRTFPFAPFRLSNDTIAQVQLRSERQYHATGL